MESTIINKLSTPTVLLNNCENIYVNKNIFNKMEGSNIQQLSTLSVSDNIITSDVKLDDNRSFKVFGYKTSYEKPQKFYNRKERKAFKKYQEQINNIVTEENLGKSISVETPFNLVFLRESKFSDGYNPTYAHENKPMGVNYVKRGKVLMAVLPKNKVHQNLIQRPPIHYQHKTLPKVVEDITLVVPEHSNVTVIPYEPIFDLFGVEDWEGSPQTCVNPEGEDVQYRTNLPANMNLMFGKPKFQVRNIKACKSKFWADVDESDDEEEPDIKENGETEKPPVKTCPKSIVNKKKTKKPMEFNVNDFIICENNLTKKETSKQQKKNKFGKKELPPMQAQSGFVEDTPPLEDLIEDEEEIHFIVERNRNPYQLNLEVLDEPNSIEIVNFNVIKYPHVISYHNNMCDPDTKSTPFNSLVPLSRPFNRFINSVHYKLARGKTILFKYIKPPNHFFKYMRRIKCFADLYLMNSKLKFGVHYEVRPEQTTQIVDFSEYCADDKISFYCQTGTDEESNAFTEFFKGLSKKKSKESATEIENDLSDVVTPKTPLKPPPPPPSDKKGKKTGFLASKVKEMASELRNDQEFVKTTKDLVETTFTEAIIESLRNFAIKYAPKLSTLATIGLWAINLFKLVKDDFSPLSLATCVFNMVYPFLVDWLDENEAQSGPSILSYLATFNQFARAASTMVDISKGLYDWAPSFITKILDYIVPVAWRKEKEVRKAFARLNEIKVMTTIGLIDQDYPDMKVFQEILDSPYSKYYIIAQNAIRLHAEIISIHRSMRNSDFKDRKIPFTIFHYGPPQVGKSTINNIELKLLSEVTEDEFTVYRRNIADAYWSGYDPSKHNVVSYDEFLQDTGSSQDALEYISLVSTAAFCPPMPSLSDPLGLVGSKGTCANPKIVVVNTNATDFSSLSGLLESSAVIGRTKLFVKMTKKVESLPPSFENTLYEVKYNEKNDSKLTLLAGMTPMTHQEYCMFLVECYAKHLKAAQRTDNKKTILDSANFMADAKRLFNDTMVAQSGLLGVKDIPSIAGAVCVRLLTSAVEYSIMIPMIMFAFNLVACFKTSNKSPAYKLALFLNKLPPQDSIVHTEEGWNYKREQLNQMDADVQFLFKMLDDSNISLYEYAAMMNDQTTVKYLNSHPKSYSESIDIRKGPMRRLRNTIIPTRETQSGEHISQFMNSISNSMWHFSRNINGKTMNVSGLHIRDKQFLVPKHFFEVTENVYSIRITNPIVADVHASTQLIMLPPKQVSCHPDKDLALIDLSFTKFPTPRSNFKKFAKNESLSYLRGEDGGMLTGLKMVGENLHYSDFSVSEYHLDDTIIPYSSKHNTYYSTNTIRYKAATQTGDCGSIFVPLDKHVHPMIVAMHIMGSGVGESGATVVTQEDLELILKTPILDVPGPMYNQPLFSQCCEVELEKPVHIMRKTMFTRTPIEMPIFKQPSDKHSIPDPLIVGVSLFGDKSTAVSFEVPENEFELPLREVKILTPDEAAVEFENLNEVNLATSAGYPYCVNGLKKKDLIIDGKCSLILQCDIEKHLKILQDYVDTVYFMVVLKDECLKPGKLARIIEVPPLWYTIITRMYFGSFMEMFHSNFTDGYTIKSSAVGVNAESLVWHDMFTRLLEVSDVGSDRDHKWWDKNLPIQLMDYVTTIINKWYEAQGDEPKNSKVRSNIVASMYYSGLIIPQYSEHYLNNVHVHTCRELGNDYFSDPCQCTVKDILFQPLLNDAKGVKFVLGGMRSGFALTTIINTMCNIAENLMFYYSSEIPPNLLTPRARDKIFRFVCYGDDSINSLNPTYAEQLGGIAFQKFASIYGQTVTPSDKNSGMTHVQSMSKLSFLKRNFGKLHDFIVPLLDKTTIQNMITWVRISKFSTNQEQLEINAFLSLRFSYFHGREYYKEMLSTLLPFVPSLPDYEYWDNIFFGSGTFSKTDFELFVF